MKINFITVPRFKTGTALKFINLNARCRVN